MQFNQSWPSVLFYIKEKLTGVSGDHWMIYFILVGIHKLIYGIDIKIAVGWGVVGGDRLGMAY